MIGQLIFTLILSSSYSQEEESGCLTLKGQPCILPFTYQNVSYNGCITINDPDDLPWCSIKTYPGTEFHISGGGHWGHCGSNCPLHDETINLREATVVTEETCVTVDGENGVCQPAATCVLLSPEEESASTCTVNSHVCCQELLENNPTILNR